jgi:hypothetical protein
MTGIADCCGRARLILAASNKAALPPNAMKSRRLMSNMGIPPHSPCAAAGNDIQPTKGACSRSTAR